jgi:hypothetical protein
MFFMLHDIPFLPSIVSRLGGLGYLSFALFGEHNKIASKFAMDLAKYCLASLFSPAITYWLLMNQKVYGGRTNGKWLAYLFVPAVILDKNMSEELEQFRQRFGQ